MMDGDYEDPTTAGMIHGVGLRHFLYWSWYQKQETLAQLAEVVERAGMGFTVYTYPAGNAQAKDEVERLAEEQAHKNQIVLPMEVSNPDAYSIQQIPPNTQGIMALQSLIDDYFGSWIIKFILGQTLSYRAEAGTPGISDLHRDSFLQIVKYDSLGVEETVTKDLIRMLLMFNFPSYQNVNFQFKLNTEEAVPLEKLQALQAAWSMGAKIKSDDVMGLIGLNVAGSTDQALYNPQVLASLKEYETMEEQQEDEEKGGQSTQITESQDEALAAMLGPIMQAKKYDKKESDMPSIKEDLHELLLKPHESQNSHQRVVDHLSAMGMEADAKNLESSKFKDDYAGYIKDLIERLFGSEEERESEEYAKDEEEESQEDEVPPIQMDLHELSWDPYESKDAHKRVVNHLRSIGMDEDADKLDSLNFMHRTDLWEQSIPTLVDALRGDVQGFDHKGHREKKAELAKLSDAYTGHVDDLLKRIFNVGHGRIPDEYAKKEKSGNYKPNQGMKGNAKRGLELRKKHGKGGTSVGVARARDIMNGKDLSFSTVKRMHSFFSRHAGNEEGGEDDAGYIAWLLWGGDSGRNWARSIVESERKNAVPEVLFDEKLKGELGIDKEDASVIDTPEEDLTDPAPQGRDGDSLLGAIASGAMEGATRGAARRLTGQQGYMYDKDDQPSYEASEEDFENPEVEILEYQSLKTPQEYVDHAHKHFGQTDDIMSSNFVHPDGSMSARAEGMSDLSEQANHIRSIKKVFETHSPDTVKDSKDRGFRSVRHFQRFGSMPLIHDDQSETSYAEIRSDLTDTQYDLLKSMLEKGRKVHVSILDQTKDDETWRGTLTDPDQVDDFKKQVKARTLEKGQPYDFDVDDHLVGSPHSAVNILRDVRVMAPNSKNPGRAPSTRDGYLFMQKLQGQFYNKLDENTEENNKAIEDALFDEGIFALSRDSDAMGWYERTFKKAQEAYFEAFPELENDRGNLAVFNAIMMFTSNGASVDANHRIALDLYDQYRNSEDKNVNEEYKFEGKESNTHKEHAQLTNTLVSMLGSTEAFADFMEREFEISELQAFMEDLNLSKTAKGLGELVGTKVRGSNIFGPKLGSFYNNLNQNHETVTMDRWFTRTYKRIMGTLTDVNESALQSQLDRLELRFKKHSEVDKDGNPIEPGQYIGRGNYVTKQGDKLSYASIRSGIKGLRENTDIDTNSPVFKYLQDRFSRFSKSDFKDKTEENRAAKNVYENVFGLADAPASGGERDRIRGIMENVRDRMEEAGFGMSMSDLQALLWYHEKRLLPHVGVVTDRQLPDDYARQARIGVDKYLGRIKKSGPEKSAPQRVQSDEPRFGLSTKNSRRESVGGSEEHQGKDESERSEETLTDEEAYEQIALAVQGIVRSALQDKMQPERNAMGAGPRDHSPEDLDVTNKQINGQATANRGTMPKQVAPSTMPSKADKGSVSTKPVSKTGMSSDATRMDRGASLDNMRDKFMKYRKTKLIEMLQPYVQEEPNFSLTDAQGKKRRTSLFKADKYSLANALAERYAQVYETPKEHPDVFTSSYAGVTETLKPYKADDDLRDELFNTAKEVHDEHTRDVDAFNSSFSQAMKNISKKGQNALNKARKGDGSVDANSIEGLDEIVNDITASRKRNEAGDYEGLMQGYGAQSGSIEEHLLEVMKGGRRLKRRERSRKNYEDALQKISDRYPGHLDSILRDEPLPDPSQVEISPEAGQGEQQEFEMAPYLTPDEERQDALEFTGESIASDPGSEERMDYDPEGEEASTTEIMELQEKEREREAAQRALLEPSEELVEGQTSEPTGDEIRQAETREKLRDALLRSRGAGRIKDVEATMQERIAKEQEEAKAARLAEGQKRDAAEKARVASEKAGREKAKAARAKVQKKRLTAKKNYLAKQKKLTTVFQDSLTDRLAKFKQANKEAREQEQEALDLRQTEMKKAFNISEDPISNYHDTALPHIDSDIEVDVNIGGQPGGKVSFADDLTGKDGGYIVKFTDTNGDITMMDPADFKKKFDQDFQSIASEAIKQDNRRWSEKAAIAGLTAPIGAFAGDVIDPAQTYMTRENKDTIDAHVLSAMRGLGKAKGGIDFEDYSNPLDAVEDAYQKMQGHINDIQQPGGYFESLEGIGFKRTPNAPVGQDYLDGIKFVMNKASETGFKANRNMNAIENMQKAFEHVADQEGKQPSWTWIAGGVGVLAMLALFYSIFRD
jgi:hypothetical protein